MKITLQKSFVIILTALSGLFLAVLASAQSSVLPSARHIDVLTCSPTPCAFPPVHASDGGKGVVNAPIAANPLNPKQLLLGSTDGNCTYPVEVAFHISPDGGSKWYHYCMAPLTTPPGEQFAGGQPMLGYDHNGVAYVAAAYGGNDNARPVIAFQKSTDAGENWTSPAIAMSVKNGGPVYSWMAVDASAQSPWVNALYVSAVSINEPDQNKNQVIVAHSYDAGTTWKQVPMAPAQISPDVDRYTTMTVGKDGTVYLAWMYCNSGPYFCDNDHAFMVFAKSTDGGNTWSKPTVVAEVLLNHEGIPNTDLGADNYPAIGVDNSNGRYAGNVYVSMYCWTGTYLRVQVVRSTDGGKTWSKPVPVAPPSDNHDQFFPWLSVSPKGLVGVSWLDRRNDPANVNYQAFATISSDGGKSFHPDVQLTTAFSNPNANGNIWIGDYTGNTWAGSNFVAAWMDNSNSYYMTDFVGGIRVK